jgi:phosphoglycerate kinase
MAKFHTLKDIDVKGKTVLVRVDLNCPIEPESKEFLDDRRIKKHAETVNELVKSGAKVVLLAHQGRPGSEFDFTTLEKHAKQLSKYVDIEVKYVPDIIGPAAKEAIRNLKAGEVILLENVRFLSEELLKRPSDVQATTHFVKGLAPLMDYFVVDAFAAAHRSQPSLVGFTEVLPSAAGKVLENEVKMLDKAINTKKRPSVFVVGGAKVKDSIKVCEQFLAKDIVDKILTTGLVANLFMVAKGYEIRGLEYIEGYSHMVKKASELLKNYGSRIEVPMDLAMDKYGQRMEISISELPLPYRIADIGTGTIGRYKYIISEAGTVIANGPAGVFEEKAFAKGTEEIMKAIADSNAFSVLGGGHLATAVAHLGIDDKISHISTGGGACILYLAGEDLAAIEALRKSAKNGNGGKK